MHKCVLNRVSTFAAAMLATLVTGCAVGPDYKESPPQVTDRFASAETTLYAPAPNAARFWEQFEDPTLNGLIDDALEANHDIRIALAHLQEERAIHRLSRFDLAPTVTASGGYTESLKAEAQTLPGYARESAVYDAGLDMSWELDFFGGKRRSLEAARAELQGAEASLHDAQVVVSAEVARVYFELRGQQLQRQVAERNVANQNSTLQLTDARLEAGDQTELDTARAQALLASSQATIAPLRAAIARSMHRLAVLTGRQPAELDTRLGNPGVLPALPELVAVGDPAELLRRRPDIRVSERALAAATARIGVATADLFPRVTFTGGVGLAASTVSGLGDAGSGTRLIAPGISWGALDLGRVRAQLATARARNDAALAQYEKSVLTALEETEDALVTHARARERLQQLDAAVTASERAAQIAKLRYEGGADDFLQVLDAERTLLANEDALAQSRTETATSLVAVYKALGGGWEGARLPR